MQNEVDLGGGARLIVRGLEDDGRVINADIQLVDLDGARWSATVLTLVEIARLMASYQETGECMSGEYFRVPDLLIVRSSDFLALVDVVRGLLRSGEHRFELSSLD